MRTFLLGIAICAEMFAATSVSAAGITIYGYGLKSCGSWTEAQAQPKSVEANYYATWLEGYLSGVAIQSNDDFNSVTDFSGARAWVDSYCKANPLFNVTTAANALVNKLREETRLLPVPKGK
jgi:transcription elongation factor Elf1